MPRAAPPGGGDEKTAAALPRRFKSLLGAGSGQLGLGHLGEGGERGLVIDSQLRQHLAVDLHAGLLKAVHKGGVVHAVHLAGGGDAGDPQGAEVTLLQPAAGVGVAQGLHDLLIGQDRKSVV